MRRRAFALLTVALAARALPGLAAAPPAHLDAAQLAALKRYLDALRAERYDQAFETLSTEERRYFVNAANYASVFAADRFKLAKYEVRLVQPTSLGTFVEVSETISFFDHAHQVTRSAGVRVGYGLVREGDGVRVKDPYHPWRAFDPVGATVKTDDLTATVRKISFFTGRIEFLVTFVNTGDGVVTLLPYGRSVLRDERGDVEQIVDTKLPALTDRNLRLGLRLAEAATYTGALTFFTPDRFVPHSLQLTVAPNLRDGADQPFELVLPAIPVPA